MIKKFLIPLLILSFIFTSCQKEVDWANNGGSGSGGSGTGGGGGTGGSTSGDLLVRGNQVTNGTGEVNVITFQWDANKRLLLYKSAGTVNGTATDIEYRITRLADGKIKNIISKNSATAAYADSVVYFPHYTGARMDYVIDSQYTILGNIRDSIAFTYNASGQIISKRSYIAFFGLLSESGKETYQYDANGNVTIISVLTPDGAGGYQTSSTVTHTYDGHKAASTIGEECYIVLGVNNGSKNNLTKIVTATTGAPTYTGTFSGQTFNSFDRPVKADIALTPVPPGYSVKVEYFYQ